MRVWARLFIAWLRRPQQREQDLRDEIALSLSEEVAQRIEAGQNREDARTSAYRACGNIGLVEDVTRQSWVRSRLDPHTYARHRRQYGAL